ncbi:hypothetical protein Krac_10409 [Ktedonobacter racemifer DSM 44963]|uniref:Uncharacterized protein n=1 Tax=Ktedonobacter racemifer DSM 44963 TaxID=485913 RepID=D6TGX2_KTERA|nr:hypothetical protein Krac_10409 [Ktedonobacter racemifer DSM 44963]
MLAQRNQNSYTRFLRKTYSSFHFLFLYTHALRVIAMVVLVSLSIAHMHYFVSDINALVAINPSADPWPISIK